MATISNSTAYSLLSGTAYSDTITNTGHHVTIYAGAGDDSINNTNRGGALTLAGAYAYIDAGEGNDNIIHYDWAAYGTVLGGAGDDTIMSRAAESTISGGDGNDSIRNVTGLVSMHGGAGNDIIVDVGFIDGINHGNTIAGGAGDDTISLSATGYENVIEYTSGEGNDIIYNIGARDKIQIGDGTGSYTYQESGTDIIVRVGEGKITVVGAKSMESVNVAGVLTNNASNAVVKGTSRAESISNLGSYVTIKAGAGDDTITTYGVAPTVTAYSFGKGVEIDGGAGDDYIDTSGMNNSIEGGAGSDTIVNTSYGVDATINGGDGSDEIRNSARAKIYGGAGGDTLTNTNLGAGATLYGGGGSDYISTYNSDSVLIDGGSGSDTIDLRGTAKLITVTGGAGDDTIQNAGSEVLIEYASGDGNDLITGFNESSTLKITGGTYSSQVSGENILVTVGEGKITLWGAASLASVNIDGEFLNVIDSAVDGTKLYAALGNDSIVNRGDKVTIVGASDTDSIWNYGARSSINAQAGDDYIRNDGKKSKVDAGAGNDSIQNNGGADNCTLLGGEGDDTINNEMDGTLSGGENVFIDGGAGNDSVRNDNSRGTISGGADNDTIYNHGDLSSLVGGSGNDSIYNYQSGEKVTIDAGAGSDKVSNWGDKVKILGGAGADTINNNGTNGGSKKVTIDGGAGSDEIHNFGTNDLITGGSGNDTIRNNKRGVINGEVVITDGGKNSTIIGGAGDDFISNSGDKVTFKYFSGDGNDSIVGFNETSTLTLDDGAGTYFSQVSGSDIIVTVGDGKITLSGAATLSAVNILGKEISAWKLDGTTATYSAGGKILATVKNVKSVDGLSVKKKVVTVSAASLNEKKVSITGDGYTLALADDVATPSTKKSWSLKDSTATYKQTTAAGYELASNAKSIAYSKKATETLATVKNVKSLDGLSVKKKVVTVSDASLDEKKVSITGDGYTLALGDDVATPTTKKSWSLKDSTATYKQTTAAGYTLASNTITYSKKSSKTLATVKGVNDKSGLKVSGKTIKLSGDALSKKVSVSGAYTFDFASDFKSASITGSSSSDTIIARGKNIFVTGGKGADIFEFKSTGTIGDYEEADKISLSSADFSIDGSDVIINDKITVAGAADKSVTYIEGGVEKIFKASTDVEYNSKGTAATLLVTYTPDTFSADSDTLITIKASAVKHSLEIIGNKNANRITGTSEDDLIDGQAGGDTISGGKGNDTLMGSAGNDSLNGGSGNDELWGGKGDDTLYGGAGSDVFIYQSGDGSDLISDYTSLDTVIILSGKVETPAVDTDGNVTFKIGSGQLTFPNSANKYIELVNTDGNILMTHKPK